MKTEPGERDPADFDNKLPELLEAIFEQAKLIYSKVDHGNDIRSDAISLFKQKLSALIEGSENQSQLLDAKFGEILGS